MYASFYIVYACRAAMSGPLQPYTCTGELLAAEAIELLRQFYAAGNPNGRQSFSSNVLSVMFVCDVCLCMELEPWQ